MTTTKIELAQASMRERGIDGWLLYDFRGTNSVLPLLLPRGSGKPPRHSTRRVMLFVPQRGESVLLVHGLDANQFDDVDAMKGIRRESYLSWRDLRAWLERVIASCGGGLIAMEYSPGCALPVVSQADAGTVELVRSMGAEVVSSANLIQACIATWSPEARRLHAAASEKVDRVKDEAFALIRERLRTGAAVNEHQVAQSILDGFKKAGLEWPDGPIVAVNEHSGDPHFEVSATNPSPIKRGDWILIDLWAREPGDDNIFSDITWVGYAPVKPGDGPESVPKKHRAVYEAVTGARDAAVARAVAAWKAKESVQGWQLDDAAMNVLRTAGAGGGGAFKEFIRHRTGHSLSPGPKVHGMGVNLDNLETHDTREVLPGLGYTVEPGLYLPEFGVRSEINVFTDPHEGPVITSKVQREVVIC